MSQFPSDPLDLDLHNFTRDTSGCSRIEQLDEIHQSVKLLCFQCGEIDETSCGREVHGFPAASTVGNRRRSGDHNARHLPQQQQFYQPFNYQATNFQSPNNFYHSDP